VSKINQLFYVHRAIVMVYYIHNEREDRSMFGIKEISIHEWLKKKRNKKGKTSNEMHHVKL
jgi:hypothetical protein